MFLFAACFARNTTTSRNGLREQLAKTKQLSRPAKRENTRAESIGFCKKRYGFLLPSRRLLCNERYLTSDANVTAHQGRNTQ